MRGHQPSVVTKLTDRGTFQAVGLVTDIEPFLRELTEFIEQEEAAKRRSPITLLLNGELRGTTKFSAFTFIRQILRQLVEVKSAPRFTPW